MVHLNLSHINKKVKPHKKLSETNKVSALKKPEKIVIDFRTVPVFGKYCKTITSEQIDVQVSI